MRIIQHLSHSICEIPSKEKGKGNNLEVLETNEEKKSDLLKIYSVYFSN